MFDMPELQTDDLDPSRPFHDSADPAYETEEEQDPLRSDLGAGFTDATRSIRVWGDEFGRVRRVRLSLRWRERLTTAPQLSVAFQQAISQLQYRFAEGTFLPEPQPQEVGEVEPLSRAGLERLIGELHDVRARADRMKPLELVGGGGTGRSRNGRVKVELGQLGDTTAVEFEPDWLEDARSSEVAAEVLSAHEDAYKNFEAPILDAAEYLEIKGETQRILAEIDAMWKKQ